MYVVMVTGFWGALPTGGTLRQLEIQSGTITLGETRNRLSPGRRCGCRPFVQRCSTWEMSSRSTPSRTAGARCDSTARRY
jgi:hypothetical protein